MARLLTTGYFMRLSPDQRAALDEVAQREGVTVRALLLSRALGLPLDDVDGRPGRKTSTAQEVLPMAG